jgi:translocation protein SEC62
MLTLCLQVESFIPLWEWDIPQKKSKKKKSDKKEKKSSSEKHKDNGGAFIEEVAESEDSRPNSRSARIEEVEDEDA